jgi:hypothetical protein
MEGWLNVKIYAGRSMCQTVEFAEQYVVKPFHQVVFSDKNSRWARLNNGLPQVSVLAPVLFGLYFSDIPSTSSN